MTRMVEVGNSEAYLWGDQCRGWHLLKHEGLSVIEEEVPAGKSEKRHFHREGRQFFYILEGRAVMELEGKRFALESGQGIAIEPGERHTFLNESDGPVRFLAITAPKKAGDRVEVEG